MNEGLFFTHCLVMVSFLFLAVRFGKEGVCAFFCLAWLMANLFVTKSIMLFGMQVTASDVYVVGAMLGLLVIQEFWGRDVAKKCVWINFLLLFFVAIQSLFQVHYAPSVNDTMQPHFEALLAPSFRLFAASIGTYLVAQYCEIALFSFMKRRVQLPFIVRALSCEIIVQMIGTVLFSISGLYGLVPSLLDIIIVSYSIKIIIVFIATPFVALTTKLFKHETVSL